MTARKSENVSVEHGLFDELSLGQALAWLELEDGRPHNATPFIHQDNALLRALRERRNQLRAHAHLIQEILQTVPEFGCQGESAFFADHSDLFLANFMHPPPAAMESLDGFTCLFKHMNNCFLCFKEYSLVLRDYFHTKQALRGHGATDITN